MNSRILIAQLNWPEDEASLTADAFKNRSLDGYTVSENADAFGRDLHHMHRVFMFEADGVQLIARYNAHLLALGIPAHLVVS